MCDLISRKIAFFSRAIDCFLALSSLGTIIKRSALNYQFPLARLERGRKQEEKMIESGARAAFDGEKRGNEK
jgi:hypothetical protein